MPKIVDKAKRRIAGSAKVESASIRDDRVGQAIEEGPAAMNEPHEAPIAKTEPNVDALKQAVEMIIQQRHAQLPAIEARIVETDKKRDNLQRVIGAMKQARSAVKDERSRNEITLSIDDLKAQAGNLELSLDNLKKLKQEFSSDVYIEGVSGSSGVGKSTTLQALTGLSDEVMPTGEGGLPITAVRAEYINSSQRKAEVAFRTKQAFMDDYVVPRMTTIAEAAGIPLSCATFDFDSFKTYKLSSITLDDKASSYAHSALRELQSAKRSLPKFERFLSGKVENIPIEEIAQYVTYPSAQETREEDEGGAVMSRVYLAVDHVRVYCTFPGLEGVPIGLIDLPGLGELNEQTARAHMRDLDHRVSHIKLILAANGTRAHFSDAMGANLDNLKQVQPGIKNRSDLITIAVNEFEGKEDAARNLEQDAQRNVNDGAAGASDYLIARYSARDNNSVLELFKADLEKTLQKTPELDREKLDYALALASPDRFGACLNRACDAVEDIRRKMPSSNAVVRRRIQVVSGNIVRALGDLEVEYRSEAKSESKAFEDYKAEVNRIHDDIDGRIKASLLYSSKEEWRQMALGAKDHYALFLDELDRVQCELVDAYGGLDVLYEEHLRLFKQEIIDVLLEAMDGAPFLQGVSGYGGTDQKLAALRSQLGAVSHEGCIYKAFDFLNNMIYRFHSSAFYRIGSILEADLTSGAKTIPSGNVGEEAKHRGLEREQKLRDKRTNSAQKVKLLEEYISEDVRKANDAIKTSLTGQKDFFRGYLADSLRFFNNYLWRADKEAFDQGVIRSIVQEYGDTLFPGDEDEKRDEKLCALLDEAMSALNRLRGLA